MFFQWSHTTASSLTRNRLSSNIQEKDLSMESWTAPGPDICRNFAAHWNRLLMEGDHLGVIYWRKVSTDPTKYRQRGNDTHLTADKLHSRIIAVKISRHMAQYLSLGQKGISKHTRGANHQILVDRAVIQHCKAKWTNGYTAWIEKITQDRVRHTWILESFRVYKVNRTLRIFLLNSMSLLKTTPKIGP